MKKAFLLLLLVGACRGQEAGNEAAGNGAAARDPAAASVGARGRGGGEAPTSLTGLYEGDSGAQKNQLCMVAKGGGEARFGLVVWGSNLHSCSGAGQARRQGERLILTMDGDETCVVEARVSGSTVSLPPDVPQGCAYYCGARARLGGATFARTGASEADALKAKDIVGDPLCG
jgi:hypothetical protein